MAAKCLFCGARASLMCDSYIGWERKRGEMRKDGYDDIVAGPGYSVPLRYRLRHTCDAPLCAACATPAGVMFVRMKHMSFAESTDYCPGHEFGDLRAEITGLQADALRANWRASVRSMTHATESGQSGLFTELIQ